MPVSIPDFPSLFASLSTVEETVQRYNVAPDVVIRFKEEMQALLDLDKGEDTICARMDEFDSLIK